MCNCIKTMARPKGFEPPTYRSVVRSDTYSQGLMGKRTPIFLEFVTSVSHGSLPFFLNPVARW